MHCGALASNESFHRNMQDFLVGESLHSNLLNKAECNQAHNISVIRQYRRYQHPIKRSLAVEQLWDHLNRKVDHNHVEYSGVED
jgi:hypothetical protein